jgi:hypothetical protein
MLYWITMSKTTTKILLGLLLCWSLTQFAQTPSAYNHYGLGVYRPEAFSSNRAMGGLGAAYSSPFSINTVNPASHADLLLTTIEAGVEGDYVEARSKDSSYTGNYVSLSHLALAFPVKLGVWGASLSFKPYTGVNYSFQRALSDTNIGSYKEYFTGKGNLYQVTVGNGVKYRGFSLGLNLSFLFGHIDYSKLVVFPDNTGFLNSREANENTIRGFMYTVGAQYRHKIDEANRRVSQKDPIYIVAGAYGSSSTVQRVKSADYWQRYTTSTGAVILKDTLGSTGISKKSLTLPGYFGAGLSFDKPDNWYIGADFKYTFWNQFKSPLDNTANANNWRLSFGAMITPDKKSKNFLKQMVYRVGAYTGTSELLVHGTQLKENGFTVGLGIPVRKAGSLLNVSFEYKNRGTTLNDLYSENFYRFGVGMILNEKWFNKRKFD